MSVQSIEGSLSSLERASRRTMRTVVPSRPEQMCTLSMRRSIRNRPRPCGESTSGAAILDAGGENPAPRSRTSTAASACVTRAETRTTSPVRFLRDDRQESTTVRGLFPIGEGAGYAGGIVSSALDGLRAARAITS